MYVFLCLQNVSCLTIYTNVCFIIIRSRLVNHRVKKHNYHLDIKKNCRQTKKKKKKWNVRTYLTICWIVGMSVQDRGRISQSLWQWTLTGNQHYYYYYVIRPKTNFSISRQGGKVFFVLIKYREQIEFSNVFYVMTRSTKNAISFGYQLFSYRAL